MTWRSKAGSELWLALLAVTLLLFGSTEADAAYRLVFQNGTSVEVRSYEDLGDSIRYPRLGGTVTVPKANIAAIEEAVHLPAPEKPVVVPPPGPAPRPPASVPLNIKPGFQEPYPQPVVPPASSPSAMPRPAPVRGVAANPIGPFTMVSSVVNILGGFIVFMVVLGIILWFIHSSRTTPKKDGSLPYEKRPSLLTAAERSFYGVLCQAVDHQYAIFAKVRLGDLLHISWGTSNFRTHLHRIDRKHVDFVLCDSTSFAPLLVIELDDSSHEREDRRERDAFVDVALEAAGLPILHITAQHAYAPADLRAQIYGYLDAGAQAGVSL